LTAVNRSTITVQNNRNQVVELAVCAYIWHTFTTVPC
jgi:hypothetical protein